MGFINRAGLECRRRKLSHSDGSLFSSKAASHLAFFLVPKHIIPFLCSLLFQSVRHCHRIYFDLQVVLVILCRLLGFGTLKSAGTTTRTR